MTQGKRMRSSGGLRNRRASSRPLMSSGSRGVVAEKANTSMRRHHRVQPSWLSPFSFQAGGYAPTDRLDHRDHVEEGSRTEFLERVIISHQRAEYNCSDVLARSEASMPPRMMGPGARTLEIETGRFPPASHHGELRRSTPKLVAR